jgi:hypothetical protein
MLRAINRACEIIEMGDQRLMAADGDCGNLPPDLTLTEWRELYRTLDRARRAGGTSEHTPTGADRQ